ncbi:telomere binding protein [Aspergillus melleus]|uniref:Telomere binding protein n=1 Tax=Aspergillus melleus TaxID=138277 RepID=A0ACC3ARJ5_9EURO|nr:telomere binding protein [Aspergillus melleus]
MDGLLTEIKTVTHDQGVSLTPTSEVSQKASLEKHESHLNEDQASSQYILAVLRSNPDSAELSRVLATLDPSNKLSSPSGFDVRFPSPTTAQILNVLVSITIPHHWESLNPIAKGSKSSSTKTRAALLRCLSSIAGISCLVTQLRSLIVAARSSNASGHQIQLRDLLSVISALLEPKDFASRLYADIESLYGNETQKQIAWRELLSLIAASRVLSTAAEALTLVGDIDGVNSVSWIGDGSIYAAWIGSNVCYIVSKIDADKEGHWKAAASLTGRALSLGYTDKLVREIYTGLLVEHDFSKQYGILFRHLRPTEQLSVVEAIFRDVEKNYFPFGRANASEEVINGIAALCSIVLRGHTNLQAQLVDWLSKGQGSSIRTAGLRRAVLATFAGQQDLIYTLLTKCLEQSADKFYIKHAPTTSQEANTQVILLAAGYLQQLDPIAVKSIGRSGIFLGSVSNRLAASSTRCRFLGMIIGTAISELVEEPGKAMKFDLEEMDSDEAQWYLGLIKTQDTVGSLESIRSPQTSTSKSQSQTPKNISSTTGAKQPNRQRVKIMSIEEIDEDGRAESEDEDDDLIPYEKPDEDPSDSDDDPTLIQRNKPTAPVYIRDLITYLRDTDNVERHELAITTAPSLIRRKTGFGTELAEQTDELALIIVGLQEPNKMPKFHELRLQSMIALIVSQPLKLGRWFSAIFFDGDLSQIQRSAILTALGLSARELAGNGEEDARAIGLPALPDSSFPSKKLPAALEALYKSDTDSPIATLTHKLSQASLQPLAATAADATSGPDALKVRTFSSRMEVEKKRQQRESQRQKSTIKDLHKVLADGFFYPLKGRFDVMIMQFSSSSSPSSNPFLIPHLLSLFIQTLTLLLSTMGPHNPSLPTLTHETTSFLLSLHTRPVAEEPTILTALLSLFLALIDLNVEAGSAGEERLVTEYAVQVIELRDWAGQVFDRISASGAGNGDESRDRARTLAAGVMVKLGEVMERFQGRLMGVGSGFRY